MIESTRTFNSLRAFHNLDACGIVDRDRRDEGEVSYLRKKRIFVPNVAEIENIFMIEAVIRAVARHYRRDENEVFAKVKKSIMRLFESDLRQQALMHTRHIVKRRSNTASAGGLPTSTNLRNISTTSASQSIRVESTSSIAVTSAAMSARVTTTRF